MNRFIFWCLSLFATVEAFNYDEFKEKFCKNLGKGQLLICEHFSLTKTDLDSISQQNFVFSTKIEVFELKYCEIEQLNEKLFLPFPNLGKVYIQNCNITLMNSESVSNLSENKISSLEFHRSYIHNNLNKKFPRSLPNLENVIISNSFLGNSTIDKTFIPNKLKNITIEFTNVVELEKGLLSDTANNLSNFFIRNGQIKEIDSIFFGMENYIFKIEFPNNKIETFDIFPEMKYIKQINLKRNIISQSHLPILSSLTNLEFLDIGENTKISEIPFEALKHTKVSLLLMPYGKLEKLNKLGGNHLFLIDFSHNLISSIPSQTFEGLEKLVRLEMGHNQISTLDELVFRDLHELYFLNLEHNSISSIHRETFSNLNKLHFLNLNSNKIGTIDGFINAGFNNLLKLNLSDNCISKEQYELLEKFKDHLDIEKPGEKAEGCP